MAVKTAILCGCTVAAIVLAMPSAAASGPTHLTDAELRAIAFAAVKAAEPTAFRLLGFEIDREADHGGYAWFEAIADTKGSVHQGFVAVDRQTADAWDGVSECGEISSPELRLLQANLRKQIGMTRSRYERVRRRGPLCDQAGVR